MMNLAFEVIIHVVFTTRVTCVFWSESDDHLANLVTSPPTTLRVVVQIEHSVGVCVCPDNNV